MFQRINLWPLILSCPISTSLKDHEIWHLQEGQEHYFCLALSPCCQLSMMAMPRAKFYLNNFQGRFCIPCNFHGGCATATAMERAPLLWSVPGWSPTCNKDLFSPGFVSTFHSHQPALFGTFLRRPSEGLHKDMRSSAVGVARLAVSPDPLPAPPTLSGMLRTLLPLWGVHGVKPGCIPKNLCFLPPKCKVGPWALTDSVWLHLPLLRSIFWIQPPPSWGMKQLEGVKWCMCLSRARNQPEKTYLSSNNEPSPGSALPGWTFYRAMTEGQATGPFHISLWSQIWLNLCLLLRLRDWRETFLFVVSSKTNNNRWMRKSRGLSTGWSGANSELSFRLRHLYWC